MAANVVSAAQPWEKSRRTAVPSRRAHSTRPQRLWSGRATSTTHPPTHSDIHALRNDGVADRFMLHGRLGREKLAAMAPHHTLHPRRLEGGRPRGVSSTNPGCCAINNLKPADRPPLAPFCRQWVHRRPLPDLLLLLTPPSWPDPGQGPGSCRCARCTPPPAHPGRVWCGVKISAQVGCRGEGREGGAALSGGGELE